MEFDQVVEELKDYILKETNIVDRNTFQNDTDIFQEGIVDSMMLVSLVLYCSEKYNCELTSDDDFENSIRTINGIATMVCKFKTK